MPRVYTNGPPRNADAFENALKAERRAVPVGVAAAAEPIQQYLEFKVRVPWPPASEPKTPAHRRTGKYQRGWKVKPRNLTLRISNSVRYAGFLEFGTKKMEKRPALTQSEPGTGMKFVRKAGKTAAETARRAPRQGGRG